MPDGFFLTIGIILAAVGLLICAVCLLSRVRCRERTEATVVGVGVQSVYLRGRTVKQYTPTFTYTFGGQTYTRTAGFSSTNAARYAVGAKMTVFVNPSDPPDVNAGRNGCAVFLGLLLLAVGLILVVCCFL